MENVRQRGKKGTFYVVQNIPKLARRAFDGKAQIWLSLRTTDRTEARSKAIIVLADLEARIAAEIVTAKTMANPAVVVGSRLPVSRPHAIAAIDRWRTATVDAAYHSTVNGVELPPFLLTSHERHSLQRNLFDEVPTFRALLVRALASQSIAADEDHPALRFLSAEFAAAILSVEDFRQLFELGLIDGWPEENAPLPFQSGNQPMPIAGQTGVQSKTRMKLSQLRDAWDAHKPMDSRRKGYVARLIEFLGDRQLDTIEPIDIDRFLSRLKQFPKTKRLIDDIPFEEVITTSINRDDFQALAPKTVWN